MLRQHTRACSGIKQEYGSLLIAANGLANVSEPDCWAPSELDREPEGLLCLRHARELPCVVCDAVGSPLDVSEARRDGKVGVALADLVRSKALTHFQADWLAEHWSELADDCWHHEPLRDVPEHTCAYLDSLRDPARWLAARQGALT